ncbi:MAG: hypothetical protein C7B44_08845 [Sulfobacillus thermosulfidooxidans]|nr:MAG: hypothetical protein C7B44_08845 [Sulfobacillus thermosulfidooxidans]
MPVKDKQKAVANTHDIATKKLSPSEHDGGHIGMSGLIGTRRHSSSPMRNSPEEEFDGASGGHRIYGYKTSSTSQERE